MFTRLKRRFNRLTACITIAGFAACNESAPVRLVVPTDTLVINSTDWTPLGIHLLDARGRPAKTRAAIRYQAIGVVQLSIRPDGSINCHDDGIGRVLVEVDTLRAQRLIRCHLARRFGGAVGVQLIAGGPPAAFYVEAYDKNGQLIVSPRFRAIVRDTTILRLENGLVYGLRAGISEIRIRSAGREGGQVYFVDSATSHSDSAISATTTRRP